MTTKPKYKTKQRDTLLSYLETVTGKHITVADVCDYFRAKGTPIGQATVYRQLESMVDDGLVSKYTIDSGSPACFEYLGAHVHEHGEACFHCKCEKCGTLFHVHCAELELIQQHLMDHHNFMLNPLRTVFYGLCENCRNTAEQH